MSNPNQKHAPNGSYAANPETAQRAIAAVESCEDILPGFKSRTAAYRYLARELGVNTTTIREVAVVRARRPDLYEQIKAGTVTPRIAYKKTTGSYVAPEERLSQPRELRAITIRKHATQGMHSEQIAAEMNISAEHVRRIAATHDIKLADLTIGRSRRINAQRLIENTVTTLEGCALGVRQLNGQHFVVDTVEAREWARSLRTSLRHLSQLRKQLLEFCNEHQTAEKDHAASAVPDSGNPTGEDDHDAACPAPVD